MTIDVINSGRIAQLNDDEQSDHAREDVVKSFRKTASIVANFISTGIR